MNIKREYIENVSQTRAKKTKKIENRCKKCTGIMAWLKHAL